MKIGRFYEVVACYGKIGHDTKAIALRVLLRLTHKRDMHVYRCRACRKWHLGSSGRRDLSE